MHIVFELILTKTTNQVIQINTNQKHKKIKNKQKIGEK
jgi:hypothetical protein